MEAPKKTSKVEDQRAKLASGPQDLRFQVQKTLSDASMCEEIHRRMRKEYLYADPDYSHKILEGVQALLSHFQAPRINIHAFLQEASDLIQRQFWLRTTSIATRTPSDGMYRYEVSTGFREDAWLAHKRLAYSYEQLWDPKVYKAREISPKTKLFLAEDTPYAEGEEGTFNRPLFLKSKRRSPLDSIEGDYLDVDILGTGGEVLGWIEVSGTNDGKLPSTMAIKWIEVISSIVGVVLTTQGYYKSSGRA